MVQKAYKWADGAKLEDHSKRKHKILRQYLYEYLKVRCSHPHQHRFRLAIVDGFAGGGRYDCGTPGSPLIFIEELKQAAEAVNTIRMTKELRPIEIECHFIFNDSDPGAINLLKENASPPLAGIRHTYPRLHLQVKYFNDKFETIYPTIKKLLEQGRYRNVLFNLDQCGDSHVKRDTILDIMQSHRAAEIFYTFMIDPLLAFLQKNQPEQLWRRLNYLDLNKSNLNELNGLMTTQNWLGTAEKIVFDTFRQCAPYVSPFSINNPGGWRYWLIHFAKSYRARQVYNNVLHENASIQAHFGRSGLNMLHYDPMNDGQLYLFDESGRESSKNELFRDIPQLVSDLGDTILVKDFYKNIYNDTPAHYDDIHTAIIENPDLEVLTPNGGERRKANRIGVDDTIRSKDQRSIFIPMLLKK